MKIFLVVVILSVFHLATIQLSSAFIVNVQNRSLIQFQDVVRCGTGYDGLDKVMDSFYCHGCWCGPGGSGEVVDEVDRCCQVHDQCYAQLSDSGVCFWYGYYFATYKFKCVQGQDGKPMPTCPDDGRTDQCGQKSCECDAVFASCLARSMTTMTNKECPQRRLVCQTSGLFGSIYNAFNKYLG